MLDESMFPRWVFKPEKLTLLVGSKVAYDQALADGWYATVGEADMASPDPREPDVSEDAPPTRAELEAKAAELGIEFHPNIGNKKLSERILAALKSEA